MLEEFLNNSVVDLIDFEPEVIDLHVKCNIDRLENRKKFKNLNK